MLQELDAAAISVSTHAPAVSRAQLSVTAVEVYLERAYDLLNDREPIAIAGTAVKATPNRMNNNNVVRDANGKWVPPSTWKTINDEGEERKKKAKSEGRRESAMPNGSDLQATKSKEIIVSSMQGIASVARTIESTRSAKSHSLNERSSRSHCLITITLQQVREYLYVSHLVFADLAGSERVSDSGVDADGGGGAKAYALTNGIRVDLGGTRLDEARSVNT